ncbi:VOC family protein [Liberiplasma polymorphum]|uniref:VOC family protein n=1 Tax=Liberiplasma polymorphum TaxID=3374570 RepID=UPI003775823E
MKNLKGIHHVTAITSSAEKIYEFFTYVLGLRLVKKTVNQDDINTYHLFFADDVGSAGTDMTFFDFKGINKAKKGTDEIAKTGFRVPTHESLVYWIKRFDHYNVRHEGIETLFNRELIYFYDFDGQEYALFSDENVQGVASGIPWEKGPVPNEYAITGLGPIFFRVDNIQKMHEVLTDYMSMRFVEKNERYSLYEMGEGGNGASVILDYQPMLASAYQGFGGVHHVAFRIEDKQALDEWIERLNKLNARHSGFVDRFYFKSLYTRLYRNILFEFATEGPGFIDDEEDYETLGETLALPPKLRNQRQYVESVVRPIDTVRSSKTFNKEYF